jgi:hypothetical protein
MSERPHCGRTARYAVCNADRFPVRVRSRPHAHVGSPSSKLTSPTVEYIPHKAWRTSKSGHGMPYDGPLASVLPDDSARIPVPGGRPVSSSSRMLESTLGYREPASADWRICPTPFEPGQQPVQGPAGWAHPGTTITLLMYRPGRCRAWPCTFDQPAVLQG